MSGASPSTGPYSKSTMRMLVAAAVVLDLIVLGIALKYTADGHSAAPMMLGRNFLQFLSVMSVGFPVMETSWKKRNQKPGTVTFLSLS